MIFRCYRYVIIVIFCSVLTINCYAFKQSNINQDSAQVATHMEQSQDYIAKQYLDKRMGLLILMIIAIYILLKYFEYRSYTKVRLDDSKINSENNQGMS